VLAILNPISIEDRKRLASEDSSITKKIAGANMSDLRDKIMKAAEQNPEFRRAVLADLRKRSSHLEILADVKYYMMKFREHDKPEIVGGKIFTALRDWTLDKYPNSDTEDDMSDWQYQADDLEQKHQQRLEKALRHHIIRKIEVQHSDKNWFEVVITL